MDSIVNIIGLHEHIMSLTPMSKITLIVAWISRRICSTMKDPTYEIQVHIHVGQHFN